MASGAVEMDEAPADSVAGRSPSGNDKGYLPMDRGSSRRDFGRGNGRYPGPDGGKFRTDRPVGAASAHAPAEARTPSGRARAEHPKRTGATAAGSTNRPTCPLSRLQG